MSSLPSILPAFAHRRLTPERMDDPALDADLHRAALHGLSRINRWSNTAGVLWRALRGLGLDAGRPARVLDVACGGGDVAVALAEHAQRDRVALRVDGVDLSDTALARARRLAERHGVDARFSRLDVLADDLPSGYDAVVSSLFLHHLGDDDVVALLRRMADASPRVVVSDLVRSRLAWGATWLGTRAISRSPVVHADGPASVAAAFTTGEMRGLLQQAGLASAGVLPAWPMRMLITWTKGTEA